MNNRLVLFIDEHWPLRPAAPWVLLDAAGRKSAEGESEPRHWPAAAECAVVLGGAQALWHELSLPRAPRREEPRLLRYALEECLVSDSDNQHLTVTHRHSDTDGIRTGVIVVARERLRSVLAQLAALGRAPVALWSELELAPAQAGAWHLSATPGGLVLRLDERKGLALDGTAVTALPLLVHAMTRARAENRAPSALVFHATPGLEEPDTAVLERELGTSLRSEPASPWWSGASATNLLHGEFAARHRRAAWVAGLTVPAWIAGASVAVLLAAEFGQVLWQRSQLDAIEARMQRVFETAMPNTPAIAPAAQLHRQLGEQRAAHGRLRDDDMLALLDAYGEARGASVAESIQALEYSEGQLRLTTGTLAPAEIDALRLRLAARGLSVYAETSGDVTKVVLVREGGR